MFYIFAAVILFGLIHPFSKLILDTGIPLSIFCLSYVGIRLIIQIPIILVAKLPQLAIQKNNLLLLITFGFIGAGLQFFEFKGINEGLSPGLVTFVMFSYPIWLAINNIILKKNSYIINVVTAMCSILGLLLISGSSLKELQINFQLLMYPFLASIFIALWIILSKKLRSKNISTIHISFFYDFFSFFVLLLIFSSNLKTDFNVFMTWLTFKKSIWLIGYASLMGLFPNLLYYYGSKNISSYTAGLIMASEPLLSTLYSSVIWGNTSNYMFWLGAILIISANLINNNNKFILKIKNSI